MTPLNHRVMSRFVMIAACLLVTAAGCRPPAPITAPVVARNSSIASPLVGDGDIDEFADNQWGMFVWVDRVRTSASTVHVYFRSSFRAREQAPTPQEITWKKDSTPDAIWAPVGYRNGWYGVDVEVVPDGAGRRAWVCIMYVDRYDHHVTGTTHWDPKHLDAPIAGDCGT